VRETNIEIELYNSKKHKNPQDKINSALEKLGCDFQLSLPLGWYRQDENGKYNVIIGKSKEDKIFETLNHETIHCVLGLIGELVACKKYNNIHYYVDWVHAGLKGVNGKEVWKRIIESRTECPRCGGVAEMVEEGSEIYQCGKCDFLYNEKHKKEWIELSESDLWEKHGIDPGYFKKIGVG